MKERPIIFSGAMVRAILDGEKTQTRRVVTDAKGEIVPCAVEIVERKTPVGGPLPFALWPHENGPARLLRCPYGVPGDRLWVRETWRVVRINGTQGEGAEFATIQFRAGFGVLDYRKDWRTHYAALLASETAWTPSETGNLWGRWRPSIFMPRWASRIALEVVSVRAERLQDITEEDARAEGMEMLADEQAKTLTDDGAMSMRDYFADGWDAINSKRAPLASNPWVWVVEFKR